MRYQSFEINYHTAPNNKSTALPILQKLISIMVCLLGRAEYTLSTEELLWHMQNYELIGSLFSCKSNTYFDKIRTIIMNS